MSVKTSSKKLFVLMIVLAIFCFLGLSLFSAVDVQAKDKDALGSAGLNLKGALGLAGPELGTDSAPISIPILIGRFFQVVLGILGLVYMCLLVYGGYSWFTASGDSEKSKKAGEILSNATWGILIVLLAFIITTFAVTSLTDAIIPSAQSLGSTK